MDHATHLYPVPPGFAARARVDARRFAAEYPRSVSEPEAFWGEVGRRLDWIRPYSKVKDVSYRLDDFHIRWYEDGTLNVAHNCLDRHLTERGDEVAIIWQGDQPHYLSRAAGRRLPFRQRAARPGRAKGRSRLAPRHYGR
jgi:acetyl-CoA synthetase